ncbi:MAG: ATP-dependent helicase [Bacteroidales bacterium]|nr:ATP-dependent helicase [Bacteroidales bacterium]MCM1416349.1 ATP-dependent helicase [bacterium]MCM1423568.1 ATP-dependent helicase [bacterium]
MQGSGGESNCLSRLKSSCTERQEKAIRHTSGPAAVLAGPGSGKTFVTAHRIHRLITSQGIAPDRILVITFTKAAALEMQARFFRLTGDERPPVHFGTFHAVFYYILRQSAAYRGYTIITETERRKLIRDIIHAHTRFVDLKEEDIEEVLAEIGKRKNGGKQETSAIQKLKEEDLRFLAAEYQSYLREFSKFDFDDLVNACLLLLQSDEAFLNRWREQFSYILIDEFQDISPGQYEIMKLIAAPKNNLFIVGDDDQAIYGFRGAAPDSMQQFFRDYAEAERILLDVNFRCHENIVAAAGKVVAVNENRMEKEIRANHGEGCGVCLLHQETEADVGKALVRELLAEQAAGTLSDCAVICRTNFDCGMWAQTLYEAKIPYTLREKPRDRFAHFVIQDIRAYLALAAGDDRRRYFLRIMNRPLRYMKRDSLPEEQVRRDKLIAWYQNTPYIQTNVRRLCRDLENLSGKRLHLQIHYIRSVIGYDAYLREKYGSEKAEAFQKVGEEFEAFSRQFATLQDMNDYISQYREVIKEDTKEREGVQILTMHASKGLEFPTVYIPDCNEGKIPLDKSRTKEEVEEERRMFYVAMTRAKRKLCLLYHNGKTGKDAPSRFLKPLLS